MPRRSGAGTGRPAVAWREDRVRFWAATARCAKSEESVPVGFGWFRHVGGVNPGLCPVLCHSVAGGMSRLRYSDACGLVVLLGMVQLVGESMPSKRLRSGPNALERGLDPRGLCSICAEPFAGFDLQDDHVMPIGARRVDEGLLLVRSGGTFTACLPSEAPADAELFSPLPCAALAHASCNMSKGATRDIDRWRHPSLSPLVVAINESGDRVVLPPPVVLPPSPEWDWTHAQREAYDRGIEALRRQGHEAARRFKTTDELHNEALRLEREHRRAEAEARANEMIQRAEAKLAAMTDWRKVRDAISRIAVRLEEAIRAFDSLPPEPSPDAYFEGCFEYDAACAEARRWTAVETLARDRNSQLYQSAVDSYRESEPGRGLAERLASLPPGDRVRIFNQCEKRAADTKRPVDRAKAEIARASLDGLDVYIGISYYHDGLYAKLRSGASEAPQTSEFMDEQGRVIDAATGEIVRTVNPPPRLSMTEPPQPGDGYDYLRLLR